MKTELITITLDKKEPKDVILSRAIDFNEKVSLLIDDVANSGKTILYALKPFLDISSKKNSNMVLVERTHNSFPVQT